MLYGVALVSRIDKIIGLLCKRALEMRQYSAKETYNLKEPTNCSHSILHTTTIELTFENFITIEPTFESFGVAMISRLLRIIGLFCRISSLL